MAIHIYIATYIQYSVNAILPHNDLLFVSDSYSNNPIVLGPDNSNLPKIFLIIADGVANESVKSEDACSKRLANVIRQVQVQRIAPLHFSPQLFILLYIFSIASNVWHQWVCLEHCFYKTELRDKIFKTIDHVVLCPARCREDCGRSVCRH